MIALFRTGLLACLLVMAITSSTVCIVHDLRGLAWILSISIQIMWVNNVRSVVRGKADSVAYVIGASTGSAIALFLLPRFV